MTRVTQHPKMEWKVVVVFTFIEKNTITMPKFYHSAADCDPLSSVPPSSVPFSPADQFSSVQISSTQFSCGARVPVSVPVPVTIPSCMTMLFFLLIYKHYHFYCSVLLTFKYIYYSSFIGFDHKLRFYWDCENAAAVS